MVTFKYVISDKLPKISYVSLIDVYVLACFIMAFFIILARAPSMPSRPLGTRAVPLAPRLRAEP